MTFRNLNLIPSLLRAVEDQGYTDPTPIQAQAIPLILQGKDVLGCAQTGTGKTAAFAIPLLQNLCKARSSGRWPHGIKALVITPTRELAIQIDESFAAYGKGTNLQHSVIFGGVKQHSQVRKIKRGIDILTATPGRLLDLMNQRIIDLRNVQILTLDEADRMLDMGFINDIQKIVKQVPSQRQSLFFSATMPPSITKLAHTLLRDPVRIEVAPQSTTAESVTQKMYFVEKENKRALLLHVLEDKAVLSALIFTRTKHGANKITQFINNAGIQAEAIHGNKSQGARQKALKNFKEKRTKILVATDIASRGIDIDELSHVINFEIPNEPETYVHRIGRTGRADQSGIALSFCDRDEQTHLWNIHKLIDQKIPVIESHPYAMDSKVVRVRVPQDKPDRNRRRATPPKNKRSFQRRNRRRG